MLKVTVELDGHVFDGEPMEDDLWVFNRRKSPDDGLLLDGFIAARFVDLEEGINGSLLLSKPY
jgi:hypothetical protein